MKLLEEIETICNVEGITFDNLATTYGPQEGINIWWIKTARGVKYDHFVVETLETDKKKCWWVKKMYDNMDWENRYIHDAEGVELGAEPFVMPAKTFIEHYRQLYEPMVDEREDNCNVVNVDYERIKNMPTPPMPKVARPKDRLNTTMKKVLSVPVKSEVPKPPAVSFDSIMDPKYPVSYVVNGNHFQNLSDVDKFIRYNKLRHMMFDGWLIYDETQMDILRRIVNNKDMFIQLLKDL